MFYGWWVVASVFMAQFFMVGFFTYGFPLLVNSVQMEFEATVVQVQLGITLGAPIGAIAAPIVGPLVDKWTARGLMLIGVLSLIVALVLMSLSGSVYQFVAAMGVFIGAANLLLGPMTVTTVVSRWFTESRGFALGISATGTSIGGVVVPVALTLMLSDLGWRTALQILAAAITLFVLPLIVFVVRDHPQDVGLLPDGQIPDGTGSARQGEPNQTGPATSTAAQSSGDILRTRAFWFIGCSLGCLFMTYVGVLANLGKYASELGLENSAAGTLLGVIAVAGFIGKLLFGYVADRVSLRMELWAAQVLAILGIGLFSTEPSFELMILAASLMGLAAGGMLPVWGAMVGAAFGVANIGRVMGLMMPVITVFNLPGPLVAAWSMDATGSYSLAMQGFVGILVIAIFLLVPLRLPDHRASAS